MTRDERPWALSDSLTAEVASQRRRETRALALSWREVATNQDRFAH